MTDISKSNSEESLPPLACLPAFEAAARFGSFSKAAQHLGASQPAVSQQIRHLEDAVGRKLFRRKSQGVILTPAGEELRQAVASGFAVLRQVMATLRQPARRTELTVATDFAFAAYWLLPRLERFKAAMPAVDVRILTAQHVDDLGSAGADIAILFGARPDGRGSGGGGSVSRGSVSRGSAGKKSGSRMLPLFAEAVYPVCAPSYSCGPARGRPDWLAKAALLHLDDVAGPAMPDRRSARWFTWDDWLRAAAVREELQGRQLRFNNYTLVLQAAVAGQGIALGWAPLVEPLIAAGQLRRAHHHVCRSPRGYFLSRRAELQSASPQSASAVDSFIAWLGREAGAGG